MTILNTIAKLLPPVAWLAICATLIVISTTQSIRLNIAIGNAATFEANALNCQADNKANVNLINKLKSVNDKCVKEREVDREKAAAAKTSLAEFIKRVKSEDKLAAGQRDEALKNDDCKALLALDIGAACPAIAGSLLQRYTLYNPR